MWPICSRRDTTHVHYGGRTALAGVLLAVFVAIAAVPGLRAGFGLVGLPPIAVGLVAAGLAAWLLLVRWLWRTRAIDRFIGRA